MLHLMQRRNSYLWTLAAFLFATVLGLTAHGSHSTAENTGPTSSPSLSKASLESVALCEALTFQFHGCIRALQPNRISHEFRFVRFRQLAVSIETSSELHYFPIRRRPPPSFS
jgi:hypothetical protein